MITPKMELHMMNFNMTSYILVYFVFSDVHKPSSPQHQHLNLPQKTDDKDISMFRAITQRLRVKRNKTSEKDHTSDLDSNSYDTSDRSSSGSVHSDTGSSHSIDRPAESKQSSYLIRSRKPRIKVSDVQEVNVLDKETSMTDQSVTVSHRVLGKSRNEHIKNMDDEQNLERVARSRAYSSGGELSRKSKFISKSMDTSSHSETSSIDDDVVGPMPPAVEAYLRKGRRTSFHKALESDLMDDDVFERKDKGTGKQTRIDSSLDRRSRKDNFKTETSDVDLPMTQKTSEKKQNVIESKPRHRVSIAGSDIGPGIPPLIDNPRQYSSTMSLDHPHHLFAKNPKHRESSWVSRHHKVYSWELTPNIIKRERSRTPDGRRSRSLPDKRHERTRSRASVESSLPDKRQERMRSHSSVESPGLEKLRSHSFVDRHKDDRHKDDEKQSTHTGVLPIFKHKRAKHV